MQSAPKPERRFAEFRADDAGVAGVILRYGDRATFGRFTERFEPGSIRLSPDVIANLMHDRMKPVARTGAGLVLVDGAAALEARIDWPDTVYAKEARELVAAGIMRGFSLEFRADRERWDGAERIIQEARVSAFAIVDRPAYPDSEISARFAEMWGAAQPRPRRRAL